jgi:Asp/Glu/hydantoin racemase
MRLLAVTPICVPIEELARRQDRYDRLAPAGVEIKLENLGTGSDIPRSLDSRDDLAASEAAVIARLADAGDSPFDGFLPDCVLDPGVDAGALEISKPVFGILKMTAHFFAGQGARVGAVARNAAIASELDRKLHSYGLALTHGRTAVLGLSVEDIANTARWNHAVSEHLQRIHVDAVINGCSAVEVSGPGTGVLVDPTALALQLIGIGARVRSKKPEEILPEILFK